ncbi:MAG: hypothetical protein HXX20_02265 [Chloroflexi bacterium]|nr:hypothetical protein [Chloroflexota bacterium]
MSAANYNLEIEQGASFNRTFKITKGGIVQNTSGYNVLLEIKANAQDTANLMKFANDGTGTSGTTVVLGGADGTITLNATTALIKSLTWTNATYSMFITAQGGTGTADEKLLTGIVVVQKWGA